ncbi:hypothetical protein VTN77DRAFT_7678 [Rasamsonia byssochlamydoides]|uniref:uncharacterized protein n=1 Tax=Rasamsonia byssochlamydoides TaxID=89139 RepID=UPI00374479D8
MDLRERLPPAIRALRSFLRFTGSVWSCDIFGDIGVAIPLFIAQAPVIVPPPIWSPVTTVVHLFDPHPDPLSNTSIDPTKPLSEEVAVKAFEETFPGSVAILKFFDGIFVVVYPENTDCSHLVDTIPTTFGGLYVDMATDKITPCTEPIDPATQSGTECLSQAPQKVELYPGNEVALQGPLFGQQPSASKENEVQKKTLDSIHL